MGKVIIAEGRTTTDAINNGLKQLHTTKENVTIKVLEEEKKMFFSILTPRVVKVEMTLKEEKEEKPTTPRPRRIIKLTKQEQEKAKQNIEEFLSKIVEKFEIVDNRGNIVKDFNDKLLSISAINGIVEYLNQTQMTSLEFD